MPLDSGWPNPRGLTQDLEELEREARALQSALRDTHAVAESPDGLIRATVSARGELVELVLDPRIYRTQDCGALAADITLAIREAAGEAHGKVVARARRSLLPRATEGAPDLEFDAFLDQLARSKGGTTA